MSKSFLGVADSYEQMKLDLARAILDGRIKTTPENQKFYESWAHRYIEWRKANYRGREIPKQEEVPNAEGTNEVKGEVAAVRLPADSDSKQGSLF